MQPNFGSHAESSPTFRNFEFYLSLDMTIVASVNTSTNNCFNLAWTHKSLSIWKQIVLCAFVVGMLIFYHVFIAF